MKLLFLSIFNKGKIFLIIQILKFWEEPFTFLFLAVFVFA